MKRNFFDLQLVNSKPRFNFDSIDELKSNITEKLKDFQLTDDIELCAKHFSETILEEISNLSTARTSRRCAPIQPWITPGLLRFINKKNDLLSKFLKNKTIENEQKYKNSECAPTVS